MVNPYSKAINTRYTSSLLLVMRGYTRRHMKTQMAAAGARAT